MSEIIKNKYLDFGGLKKYDELIKGLIAAGNKELADAIAALDTKLGSLEFEGSDDKSFAEVINDIYSSIADLVAAQDELGAKDVELEGKINSIIGDLESLEGSTLSEIAAKLTQHTTDIAGVEGRVATLEGTIDDLKNLGGENGLVAVVDKVNANMTAIETLNGGVEVEGSVKKAAADAQAAAEATAAADATAKADAAQAAAEATAAADATSKANAAEAAAKGHADSLNTAMDARVVALEAIDHDHSNKAELDLIVDGDKAKWDEAYAKRHEHSNLTVLEGITAAKVSAWDAAEGNAKTYADGLNTAMDARVVVLETWHNNFQECSEKDIQDLFA